jgi:hypothetical protein
VSKSEIRLNGSHRERRKRTPGSLVEAAPSLLGISLAAASDKLFRRYCFIDNRIEADRKRKGWVEREVGVRRQVGRGPSSAYRRS